MTPEEIAELEKSNSDMETKLKALESAGGGDKTLQERNNYLEGEMKKIVESREKAKNDRKIAEDKALVEKGEFKILSENQATLLTDLTKKLAGHEETLGKIKERDEATLQTRLEAISDETLRETVKNNSGTLAEKIDLAGKLATVKPAAPGARPGGDGGGGHDYSDMTAKQKLTAARANGDIKQE